MPAYTIEHEGGFVFLCFTLFFLLLLIHFQPLLIHSQSYFNLLFTPLLFTFYFLLFTFYSFIFQPLLIHFQSYFISNTGTVDSDEVVLGFIAPPGAGTNGVPLQSLFGFERVFVKAGASVDVYLYPSLMEFAQTNKNGSKSVLVGNYTIWFGVKDTQVLGGGYVETVVRAW